MEYEIFVTIAVILVGLAFGSFATAIIYRIPRGLGFVSGRSKCPKCSHPLEFTDLFPVFSWVFSFGKCRHCKSKIPLTYPAIETSVALAFFVIFMRYGIDELSILMMILTFVLVVLVAIDFEHYIIPDSINIFIVILGAAYLFLIEADVERFFVAPILSSGIGLFLRWLMSVWKNQEALGLGDIKFLAASGLFLEIDVIMTFFFIAGMLGIVTYFLWKVMGKGEKFPFGPALAFSLFICLIFPEVHYFWQEGIKTVILRHL